ncbi:uncharacterized protein LOC104903908 [Beta vulgaris subsp. vulgaris]|uniref:uncharacterized protein LOC104903908 n=1 Tax=Beta vulgaris subsp. vulgaris TaxID=3555 RepID=UPI0020373E9C|nr:uncharacterized protein LOC104903908 [Beta vulgaris subsp. vulgaris]
MASTGKFRQLLKKYGKVGLGVHFSVSAASISGLYVAIKNNVDVESLLHKVGMGSVDVTTNEQSELPQNDAEFSSDLPTLSPPPEKKRNRTAELAASSGGAFALALLCNKALFPIRVPITIALTPPIARFLARRNLIRTNV